VRQRVLGSDLEESAIGLGSMTMTGTVTAGTTFDDTDLRGRIPRFAEEARTANQGVVELLGRIVAAKIATAVQIALALAVVPQAVDRSDSGHHEAASDAGERPRPPTSKLTAGELADLEQAAGAITIQGGRHPDALEAMTNL
jgi:hypothetical protein